MAAPDDSLQPQPAPYTHERAPKVTPLVGRLKMGPFLASNALVLLHKKLFAQATRRFERAYPGAAASLQGVYCYATHARTVLLNAGSDLGAWTRS
ncbi:hypothetical protein [Mycetohabitans rhizoxinica]|uniref:Uncharacterized protein n=1 Tax=Mycetohabitans rhizoxinica TaxID=412963 RepID=A0ABZ2Q007_9BURK